MKYYIWILGCQYNEWDGARIKYALSSLGLEESDAKSADIVIILSCSVRQTAIDRILGRVKNWIPRRPSFAKATETAKQGSAGQASKKIYLTGCVLEADRKKFEVKNIEIIEQGNVEELLKQIRELLSKRDSSTLRQLADSLGMTNGKRCHSELVSESPRNDNNLTIQQFNNLTNLVPIMIGCNNFCAYCAVPHTRGREKSRDFDEIISDVKKLIENGQKEIILLGQNVNSYAVNDKLKVKSKNKRDFTILLETLNNLDGDFIISFTSNHPKDMSEDIIHAVSELPKIKKAIHLPLQSGSDKILKAMNRPYAIAKYLDIIKMIKETCPKIEISTDVIVGFPGETEEEFQETVEILKQVKFSQVFINKYSPRQGTKAYELGDPVSWEEKQRRWNVLNDIAYHKKY